MEGGNSASSPLDRRVVTRLEKENKALRLEIGQERFKADSKISAA